MQEDERDLLEVLKDELKLIESGGYARSPGTSWTPVFIFEDSPACMNHDHTNDPESCGDCVLMQLVPPEFRSAPVPCRHIPLNAVGETLDSLYRYGDEHEIEETVMKWLQATISELEEERRIVRGGDEKPCDFGGEHDEGSRSDRAATNENELVADPHLSHVKHFWPCERCSGISTLVYEKDSGVVLKLLGITLATDEAKKVLKAVS